MALGMTLGAVVSRLPRLTDGATNIPIATGLIVMMFPPLEKKTFRRSFRSGGC